MVTLFFLQGGLMYVLLLVATLFAGLAAARRKDSAVFLLFMGLLLLAAGASCSNLGMASAMSMTLADSPSPIVQFSKMLLSVGRYVSVLGWLVFAIGWVVFWQRGKRSAEAPTLTIVTSSPAQ